MLGTTAGAVKVYCMPQTGRLAVKTGLQAEGGDQNIRCDNGRAKGLTYASGASSRANIALK